MLSHRLRRWANIKTALGECHVFAGMAELSWSGVQSDPVGPPAARAILPVTQPLERSCRSLSRWSDPAGPLAAGATLSVPQPLERPRRSPSR